MDIISLNEAATANGRIESFIENPDSTSGIVTVPKVIEAGENITIPTGRVAVLPNVQVDGTLNVEAGGEVFIPAGANFSGVVEKQSSNITVDVGVGQTYTTINQALEYLSTLYPLYKSNGVTTTINLKAGFVMNEQVLVRGLDLGWITIVGEDAETIIDHTALTINFNGRYPAFGVDNGGTCPIIGQLFHFNVEKVGENKDGIVTFGAGTSANVLTGCGFIGAGSIGIYASQCSTINAYGANASNAGTYGITALTGSIINAVSVNASNALNYGIIAQQSSIIIATKAIIQNQTTGTNCIRVIDGSHIEASSINTTGSTVTVLSQTANTLTGNGIIYQ